MRYIALVLVILLTLGGMSHAHDSANVSFGQNDARHQTLDALWSEPTGRVQADHAPASDTPDAQAGPLAFAPVSNARMLHAFPDATAKRGILTASNQARAPPRVA